MQWLCGGQRRDHGEAGMVRVPAAGARQVPAGDTVSEADHGGRGEAFFFFLLKLLLL